MAIFRAEEVDNQDLDWTSLQNGGVSLYWREEILQDDLDWLKKKSYAITVFDAGKWKSVDALHAALQQQLSFPDYNGNNLDALNDCLCELEVPEIGGLVLVFKHFDQFHNAFQREDAAGSPSDGILSIAAGAVRYHMLFGRRLLIFVQSDDPSIHFRDLGAVAAIWNQREWLNRNRNL